MTTKRPYWCGPAWLPRPIRKLASVRFNASCRLHDRDYDRGIDRQTADRRFYDHMLRQSKSTADRIQAGIYYGAVRAFGWAFHK